MYRLRSEPRRGFTFVELIVVIGILGVLVGMLFPALSRARAKARVEKCQDNLHNIEAAIHNYASGHGENFPPLLDYVPGEKGTGWTPFWLSVYEYVEATDLLNRARGSGAGWNAGNHEAVLEVLLCPGDPSPGNGLCTSGAKGWAGTSYAPMYPLFGAVNEFDTTRNVHIAKAKYTNLNLTSQKGNANQVGVVERYASFPVYGWSNATFYPMSKMHFGLNAFGSAYGVWGLHPPQTRARLTGENAAHPHYPNSGHKAMNVLMIDGAIRQVSASVSPRYWSIACDPEGYDPATGQYGSVLPGCW